MGQPSGMIKIFCCHPEWSEGSRFWIFI